MAFVVSVFAVADRADGEYHLDFWLVSSQQFNSLAKVFGTFVDGQFLFLKQGGRPFLAIVHNLARFFQPIDVVGT